MIGLGIPAYLYFRTVVHHLNQIPMNQSSKIIITILLIIGFFVIAIFLQAAGASKTFIGLFAVGLFFGIIAMWKKPKEDGNKEIKLDKKIDKSDDLTLRK